MMVFMANFPRLVVIKLFLINIDNLNKN
jgi:hypothetical protein